MNQLFFWFSVIVAFVFFLRYLEHLLIKRKNTLAYRKRGYLMTKAELEFFHVLESIVKNQYYIVPQLPISKIVLTVARGKDYYTYLNKIDRKTVDFVLFDKQSFSPIMVIELDDSSHDNENRRIRDDFVDNVMKNVGLKIIHVKTAAIYNPEGLSDLILNSEGNHKQYDYSHEIELKLENDNGPDEEIKRLMDDYDLDEETAEKVQELIDEGLDEYDAVERAEDL